MVIIEQINDELITCIPNHLIMSVKIIPKPEEKE